MSTWNPSDKGTHVILSNGNLTATTDTFDNNSVRGTTSQSSGKWYFEILVNHVQFVSFSIGIMNASATLNSSKPGSTADGRGVQPNGGVQDFSTGYSGSMSTFTDGDVIGFALDMAGTLDVYKNNTYQLTFNALPTGAIYPAGDVVWDTVTTDSITLRPSAASQSYTPPSGFTAWDGAATDTLMAQASL